MNWVFEHSQDPDFAAPFEVISSKGSGKSEAKYEDISQIVALGFNEIQARNALLKFVSYLRSLFLELRKILKSFVKGKWILQTSIPQYNRCSKRNTRIIY